MCEVQFGWHMLYRWVGYLAGTIGSGAVDNTELCNHLGVVYLPHVETTAACEGILGLYFICIHTLGPASLKVLASFGQHMVSSSICMGTGCKTCNFPRKYVRFPRKLERHMMAFLPVFREISQKILTLNFPEKAEEAMMKCYVSFGPYLNWNSFAVVAIPLPDQEVAQLP